MRYLFGLENNLFNVVLWIFPPSISGRTHLSLFLSCTAISVPKPWNNTVYAGGWSPTMHSLIKTLFGGLVHIFDSGSMLLSSFVDYEKTGEISVFFVSTRLCHFSDSCCVNNSAQKLELCLPNKSWIWPFIWFNKSMLMEWFCHHSTLNLNAFKKKLKDAESCQRLKPNFWQPVFAMLYFPDKRRYLAKQMQNEPS